MSVTKTLKYKDLTQDLQDMVNVLVIDPLSYVKKEIEFLLNAYFEYKSSSELRIQVLYILSMLFDEFEQFLNLKKVVQFDEITISAEPSTITVTIDEIVRKTEMILTIK